MWNHTMLLTTRHKCSYPALTPPSKAGTQLSTQTDGRLSRPSDLIAPQSAIALNESLMPYLLHHQDTMCVQLYMRVCNASVSAYVCVFVYAYLYVCDGR